MTEEPAPLVLIVDDNEKNLRLARDVLHAAGICTIEAATGAEALAHARERQPAVVLLDLRLPDMDGSDVVRELKGNARTQGIPVIAMTSLALDEGSFLEAGFDGYLGKPIDVRTFPDAVRGFFEG
jgi:two-component system cell cycle response regulator DivK